MGEANDRKRKTQQWRVPPTFRTFTGFKPLPESGRSFIAEAGPQIGVFWAESELANVSRRGADSRASGASCWGPVQKAPKQAPKFIRLQTNCGGHWRSGQCHIWRISAAFQPSASIRE